MMHKHYLITTALLILTVCLNGCMPSFTHTQGTLSIKPSGNKQANSNIPNEGAERYIVVSLWDYPTVNEKKGGISINKVILTEEKSITIDFPSKAYMVVWTPVFGTQHLAPEPGILVLNKDYLPSWNVGGTDINHRMCCDKPRSKHNFSIELFGSEQALLDEKGKYEFDKWFFEEFLAEKKSLLKKMKKCKGLTDEEVAMVLDKLSTAARILGVEYSG